MNQVVFFKSFVYFIIYYLDLLRRFDTKNFVKIDQELLASIDSKKISEFYKNDPTSFPTMSSLDGRNVSLVIIF